MAKENNFIEENINIYIDYDFITIEQYSSIIKAINEIYKEIVTTCIYQDYDDIDYPLLSFPPYSIPLCLEEINTGNSITTKITLENRFFPSFTIENGEVLKIALPKWTATLILVGMIGTYGIDKYEQYLDIRIKQLDVKIKEKELAEKSAEAKLHKDTKIEIQKQSAKLQSIKKKNNHHYSRIQQNYYLIQTQIQQTNINVVEINGDIIKENDSIN
ncbi:hypothetical protein Flavo103_31700 [Flavobacterium collinsii]|uniref:hypothetical protein n=1 Tax=Flavobacterium collinsii TaxID=1114861 RepID=UPI0022CB5E1D|nr:hypothetical protein [Flavobacterium collinsii]GIQ60034.1 hypothetical protein Flavo103_31700 [Flavobacterium collinsii]